MKIKLLKRFVLLICILLLTFNCNNDKEKNENTEIIEWGTDKRDTGRVLAFDNDNNIYVAGETNGNLAFMLRTECINQNCEEEIFITKFNENNIMLWTKILGTDSFDFVNSLEIDKDNNIYLAGGTSGSFNEDFNYDKSASFLMKLDSNGERLWVKQWSNTINSYINNISFDNEGNIYVLGENHFDYQNDLGKEYTFFLEKFTPSGIRTFLKEWSDGVTNIARSMKIDDKNNIYILGTVRNINEKYNFLKKIELSPNLDLKETSHNFNIDTEEYSYLMDLDKENNIYVLGNEIKVSNANPEETLRIGRVLLIKFDNTLKEIWRKNLLKAFEELSKGLFVDKDNIYITGVTTKSMDNINNINCDKTENDGECFEDIFLVKFKTNGSQEWTRQWGSDKADFSSSIVVSNNYVYIAGTTYGSLNGFENFEDDSDIFLIKTFIEK